jgi:hypothetical protein
VYGLSVGVCRGVEIGQNLFSGAGEFSDFFMNLTNLTQI